MRLAAPLLIAAAPLLPGLSGCADAPPPGFASVTDSAGVTLVRTIQPVEGDAPFLVAPLEPRGEIGPHFLGGSHEVGTVRDLAFSPGGRLLVLSATDPVIRWFDPGGSLLREGTGSGLRGEAPWDISLLAVDRRERLSVWEATARRITELGPDGSLREGQGVEGVDGVELVGRLTGGRLLLRKVEWVDASRGQEERVSFHIQGVDGSEPVSLGAWPGRRFGLFRGERTHLPFTFGPVAQVRGNEVLVALPEGRVLVFDARGVLRQRLDPGLTPRRLSEEDREAFLRLGLLELGEGGRERLEGLLALVPDDARLPVFDAILLDPEGTAWLRQSVTDPRQPTRWSLLDPRGHRRGEVETPPGLVVRAVHPERVAGIGYHPMMFQVLRIHELRPALSPPP